MTAQEHVMEQVRGTRHVIEETRRKCQPANDAELAEALASAVFDLRKKLAESK
jgi:hypothetical protein